MTEVYFYDPNNYPRYFTFFDEDECQGHAFSMRPEALLTSDDLARIADWPGRDYYLSPDQIKTISVPYGLTVTVYEEPR